MKEGQKDYFKFFEKEFSPPKAAIILFSFLSFMIGIITYPEAEVVRRIIDYMVQGSNKSRIVKLFCIVLLIYLTKVFLNYVYLKIKWIIRYTMLERAEEKMIVKNSKSQKWADTELQLVDRFTIIRNDLVQAVDEYLNSFLVLYSTFLSLIAGIAYGIIVNVKVTLIIIVIGILVPIVGSLTKGKIEKAQSKIVIQTGRYRALLINIVENIEVIKAFLDRRKLFSSLEKENQKLEWESILYQKFVSLINTIQNAVGYSLVVFVILFSVFLIYKKEMKFGDIYAMLAVSSTVNDKVMSLINIFTKRQTFMGLMTRINIYYEIPTCEDKNVQTRVELTDKNSDVAIEVQGVSYKYKDKNEFVLCNLSKVFGSGKIHAVVGESGCGKSTLLKMICNLLPIEEGKVKIFGKDIAEIDREKLWDYIEYIPQNIYFFEGTVKENITLLKEYDQERMDFALKNSRLKELVDKLPNGLDSRISSDGNPFSTGEKKKLVLARAFYNDKTIWLMDETLNGIDVIDTERIMINLKKRVENGKNTIIIVTHNPDVIKMSDEVHMIGSERWESEEIAQANI
ncbi:ABC-type multidrug transport system, ATPase and permease component [Caldanaerobius fijiensis DSM 17918]|uniref:ABC-type multidrug transport system, ATPase and permease component n=1 Tax=Caldanaerobius fijiensis DSM 17918 TaxID=1121256 RepID=A0A1M5FB13_9THEO|nr:ABC transporter ATP-binding protein [Caldanaerobius fijiensis]SHF88629.1 ABC-type multidrug transport system, ATPase and permease component [Caldanaerobius fijiensis DSM 17918]